MANQHPPLPEPGQLSELGIDFIRQCLTISPDQRPSAAKMREHPWIQNLIDVLNAANAEEEAAAAAANNSNSGSSSNLNVPAPTTAATSLEAPAEEETKELGSLSTSAPADQGKPEEHGQAHPPKADPGHPYHEHPGAEAQVADMAYRGEDKQTDEILAPGPPDLGNNADDGEAGALRGGE
ncbi:hypothetical protein L7F22_040458 [Adiantum nelumboides]|nr:hypothetical protein [Adiantum nelumboides]